MTHADGAAIPHLCSSENLSPPRWRAVRPPPPPRAPPGARPSSPQRFLVVADRNLAHNKVEVHDLRVLSGRHQRESKTHHTGSDYPRSCERLLAGRGMRPGRARGRRWNHEADPGAARGGPVGDLRRRGRSPRLPPIPGGHLRCGWRAGGLTALPGVARCTAGANGHRMGRSPRPDQLRSGEVHRGRISAGRRRTAAAGRRPRGAGVLRRARRRAPGRTLCRGQAGTPGHPDRSRGVCGLRRRDPLRPRDQSGRHLGRGGVLVQERRPAPAAGARSIPTSPSRISPCSTCWTRTCPGATCRAASRIR